MSLHPVQAVYDKNVVPSGNNDQHYSLFAMSCSIQEFDPAAAAEDLQHQYHRTTKCGVAPGKLAPELVILHDVDEARDVIGEAGYEGDDDTPGWPSTGSLRLHLESTGTGSIGMHDILHGFNYIMKFPKLPASERNKWRPSPETEILVVSSPEFNALEIKYRTLPGFVIDEGYVADHTFQRREPDPGDGGHDIIRQALARCQGCWEKGYHRPQVDISCKAFGVPVPGYPNNVSQENIEKTRAWLNGAPPEEPGSVFSST